MTNAQHYRAEFWAERFGWVPADPTDVRKAIHEEKPGLCPDRRVRPGSADDAMCGWERNLLGDNLARDLRLPGSRKAAAPFSIPAQAESAQGRMEALGAGNFRCRIVSKEAAS